MKVGYFISHFPYENQFTDSRYIERYQCSGGEIAAYELAASMARRGHEVIIFTASIDHKDSIEEYDGLTIYRYGARFKIGDTQISFKLLKAPLLHSLDIVHAQLTTPPGVISALIYARREEKPLILTHHGFEKFDNYGGPIRRISMYFSIHFLVDKFFSSADAVVALSQYFVEESRFLGKYRNRVVVIPNGVNLEAFDIPYSKEECRQKLGLPVAGELILFLGTFAPRKGPDVLTKAMVEIVEEVPNTTLILGGKGVMRGKLERLAKELGVERFVKFVGFVTADLKPLYYKATDVFVLPSTLSVEVFPIALLEASAAGIPMVVSDLETFGCIIEDKYNGIVTQRDNKDSLARAIICLLQDRELRSKMSRNAKERARDFSWDKIAEDTEELYRCVREQTREK